MLEQDAGEYARAFSTTLAEAMWRLQAQQATVAATDAIAARFGDRLVGISIDHRPAYRIVVLLTGWAPVADTSVMVAGRAVPILFRIGFVASRQRILDGIVRHQAELRGMVKTPPGFAVDQRHGALVVMVSQADAEDDGLGSLTTAFEQVTGLPVTVQVLGHPEADFEVVGGGLVESIGAHRRYACTAGFVVTDGARTAIATAAHCPDALDYVDANKSRHPLSYVGAWGAGAQDVQVNASIAPLQPLFHADAKGASVRRLASWRNHESTRAGDFVCHAGERSGYTCAVIDFVEYAPAGDLCYGPCPPTWVAVEGPGCAPGDSGGPVFSTSIAFGILKGGSYQPDGRCNFYFYMSTDYLPPGWSLLH